MELYFLGTGAGLPSKQRNVTSIALRLNQERGRFWLIDCGEATQHQMLSSPLRPTQLEKVFITHLHGDHIYGLPGLLGSRAFQAGETPLELYGPPGLRNFVEISLRVSETHLAYALHINEIEEGLVFEDQEFRVTCARLVHGVASYGYRIEEKPSTGRLRVELLQAQGAPEGPLYGKLKSGEDVRLPDGRLLLAREYRAEPVPGRIVVVLGDTRPCDAVVDIAKNADVLVHEATYANRDHDRAVRHHHSTTGDAADAAAQARVKTLILTHLSARYDESAVKDLLRESQAIFSHSYVAKDHWSFEIPRHT